jgi:hypothetical protein
VAQPALGVASTLLIVAISLGFISLFDFPRFSGWVAYYLLCLIPMEIVVGITWSANQPGFAAKRSQPYKGALLTLLCLAVGAVVAAVQFATIGGRVSPPPPMAAMCGIVSVVITFWAAIMWGGWPFTTLIKNPIAAGLAMLLSCYIVNYILFRIFFDYAFMRDAPVYVPGLDPHGLFNAWKALVFYVTATAVMFLMLNFDLWPLTKSPGLMKQPVLGLVWTLVVLVVTALVFYLGVEVMAMDPVAFMVKVPIPLIFGTIVVLNMLQGSLFGKTEQPLKGVLNFIAAVLAGSVLAMAYGALAPTVTGALKTGPPGYDFEIWLASALLSVTFPFLIFYAEFFKMWPLRRVE